VTAVSTITRRSCRKPGDKLNILTFPTHERYQTNLSATDHNFYLWQGRGIKPWSDNYAPLPSNHILLDPDKDIRQIPAYLDLDLVLSQNKFGQFQVAEPIARQLDLPLISLEHTLPMTTWSKADILRNRYMSGDVNLFISEYSRGEWGWEEDDADVVHHGIDTELFKPNGNTGVPHHVLSVVNDWVNRDWCCGFNLWKKIVRDDIKVSVFGDTPGLSEPAESTEQLVREYNKATVFLNTSLISPVPTALMEAMSCGCPVVSTATCMIPEIIEDGVNGFISNDPEVLRDRVKQLLDDEGLRKKMGEAARETIVSNYGLEKFVNRWNEVFEKCLQQHSV